MRQAVWAALFLLAVPVSADEVFLKSGGRISGIVVEQSATRIVLQTGPGTVALPRTSVDHVVQQQSALQIFDERAARLHPSDREGLLDLALWARDQGLETRARETFLRLLSIDPGNALALAGVGRVWMNNRWLTEEEAHIARGDVRFEGSWMSREEREDRIREQSERRADDRARRESDARVAEADARAREAEAAARRAEADSSGGIPYGWVAGGGYLGGGYVNGRAAGRPPHTSTGHRSSPPSAAVTPPPASRDTGHSSRTEAPPRRN
jgi:hypothetical protein